MIRTTLLAKTLSRRLPENRFFAAMTTSGVSNSRRAEYKQLGKSGLRVSVPILGAMSFGDKRWMPWVIEEDQVPFLMAYTQGPS